MDDGRGGDAGQKRALVASLSGELANLLKRARIDQRSDTLADRQPTALMMFGDCFLAAKALRLRSTQTQFLDLG